LDETTLLQATAVADPLQPTASAALREAEHRTLAEPAVRAGLLARALFGVMDIAYGKALDLRKFVVLELVARVPYQAWENVAYVAISHRQRSPAFARRIFEYVREARAAQDNEQWHLFILQELMDRQPRRRAFLLFGLLPQLLAFGYYHISWLLYVLNPRWSYALNADFEAHAERSYMRFVHEHAELDVEPWSSAYTGDYGAYDNVGDLLRRIALDERAHRFASLQKIEASRFELSQAESES